jgi:hypothetical protein
MLKITKHYDRYRDSRGLQFKGEGWITVVGVPESRLYRGLGLHACDISDEAIANEKCEEIFGCSLEMITHTLLSESVWGLDRNGLYLCRSWDNRYQKRPKRMRPSSYVENIMQRVLCGEEFLYPPSPVLIYECSSCGRAAEKTGWNWGSMPGLAASDYITNCPKCGLKQGDILDNLSFDVEKKERLKIRTKWSHGKQFVWKGTGRKQPVFVNEFDFRDAPSWRKKMGRKKDE